MNEFAPHTPENLESLRELAEHELPTAEQAEALRPGEQDPIDAQQARQEAAKAQAAEAQSNPVERLQAAQEAAEPALQYATKPDKELRAAAASQGLRRVQRQLPTTERAFSKLVHQPVVRILSESAAKTVSRPSGLLGGGIVALLGTSGYLYLAKHLGFTYNYFVFLLLFVAGFIIGLVLELAVHLAAARRDS